MYSKIKIMKCYITHNGWKDEYKEPTYTKINGIYGYICVSNDDKVYFFWHDGNEMVKDDLEEYKVSYEQ